MAKNPIYDAMYGTRVLGSFDLRDIVGVGPVGNREFIVAFSRGGSLVVTNVAVEYTALTSVRENLVRAWRDYNKPE